MKIKIGRFINKVAAYFSSLLQTSRVYNKPVNVIFEMASYCNLNCPLCNTGGMGEHFKHIERGLMKFETFKKGLDKLLPEIGSVLLYNWGEPFLNKDIFKCIKYARKNDVETQLSTNMMLYSEEVGRKLIESRLTKLIVSCEGLTQETYGKYRVGGDLSRVTEGVENMIMLKKELGSEYPLIEMQFVVFKHNEDEMERYEQFWKSRGVDSVNFIRMSFMSKPGEERARKMDLIPENKNYQPFHPYGTVKRCTDLYNHITVDWNGDWYTCCFPSGEKEFQVGNIVKDDFWKIWNGERYQYCRKLVKTQRSEGKYCETMCHDCTGIYPRPDTKRYWK
jgi:radical SAM protein with 4Fe4S-binding SPASM domain